MHVKGPSPCHFGQSTADERTSYLAQSNETHQNANEERTLFDGTHNGDDGSGSGEDAGCTDTDDGTADDEHGRRYGQGGYKIADQEDGDEGDECILVY